MIQIYEAKYLGFFMFFGKGREMARVSFGNGKTNVENDFSCFYSPDFPEWYLRKSINIFSKNIFSLILRTKTRNSNYLKYKILYFIFKHRG